MKIQVILGSTRQNRMGDKVAKAVSEKLRGREDFEVELIDLRDWPLPFFNEVSSPIMLKGNYSVEIAKDWSEKIKQGDGFVIVTPEYNHGYPAVLKNALDYLYDEWNNKPVAFVSYGGGVGGSRSVEQLRLVAIELQMAPIRNAVHIPMVWQAFDDQGKLKDESFTDQINNMGDQLLWWAKALKKFREE